jgi:hypothetical protein
MDAQAVVALLSGKPFRFCHYSPADPLALMERADL